MEFFLGYGYHGVFCILGQGVGSVSEWFVQMYVELQLNWVSVYITITTLPRRRVEEAWETASRSTTYSNYLSLISPSRIADVRVTFVMIIADIESRV